MSFKNLVKSLLFVFLLSISGITEAKPFLLNYEDVNMGLLEEKNVLTDFKAQYAPQVVMMKTMEAVQGGQLDPEDPESMKAFEKQLMDKYYQDAFALRKTIKEPQMRLLLDKEIVRSLGEQGETEKIYNLITKAWDGSSKLFLAMAAFDALKSSKFNDIGQLKKIFEEGPVDESTPLGKKTRLVASGFLINPAGMMFPNFPDGKKTTDGEPLSIERFKGKVILVDFWASWCPPCRAEVAKLVSAYENYKNDGFEIIGISFDQDKGQFEGFLKEFKMEWPQYFDGKGWGNEVGSLYGITSIPAMYLLDKEGKVITSDLREGKLEEQLAKLFN